jgi:hypothetical protein
MKLSQMEIMLGPDEVRNVAVTCKCGHRNVFVVPIDLLAMGHATWHKCEACEQKYAIALGTEPGRKYNVVRLDKFMNPEKLINPPTETGHDKWMVPGNNLVN